MPHVGGREGQEREHRRGREAVFEDIARAAIAAAEIHGQDDGHRQGGRDAGQPRHRDTEPAVGAVVCEKTAVVGDHFEQRGHGVAGRPGRMGRALWDRGDNVHRNLSPVALSAKSRLKSLEPMEVGHGNAHGGSTRRRRIYCQGGVLPL